ncbi:MAG: protein TolR [Desulfobacteraceae bacterium]|nr:protein TolR [Desulfobacteraceae bacterium]MCF8096042.1 protein TolR [Desulfobacteraceae bacterium]
MTGPNKSDSLLADINVTPFVDVMLVLLIIFMVAAPMMVQGVNISLPETKSAGQLDTDREPLVITIDKDSKVRINDNEVGVDLLGEKLKKIFENRSSREVFLKADKNVPYGRVVVVMSEIKNSGVEKLGVVTIEPAGGAEESEED